MHDMPNAPTPLELAAETLSCSLPSGTRLRWECAVNGSSIDLLAWDDARNAFAAAHDVEPACSYTLTGPQALCAASRILAGEHVDHAAEHAVGLDVADGCDACRLPECDACVDRAHSNGDICQLAAGECAACDDRRRMERRRERERDDHDFAYECARDDRNDARNERPVGDGAS